MLLGRSALPSANLSFIGVIIIWSFFKFGNNSFIVTQFYFYFCAVTYHGKSCVLLKHFNLRKSQIMINCVLGKLKSCFRQFESVYKIIFLFSLIAYKNTHAKGFKFKTSILVPYLDTEKVKFQTVVFWFTCHLPWSQLLYFEMNIHYANWDNDY